MFHLRLATTQALNSMLDREMWQRLPVALPSLVEAISGEKSTAAPAAALPGAAQQPSLSPLPLQSTAAGAAPPDFAALVAAGNPWRRRSGAPRRAAAQRASPPAPRLGFAGATPMEDGRPASKLEVDEYGIPRTASHDVPRTASSSAPGPEAGHPSPAAAAAAGAAAGAAGAAAATDPLTAALAERRGHLSSSQGGEASPSPGSSLAEISGDGGAGEEDGGGASSTADSHSNGGEGGGEGAVTNSSWRMVKWMRDYCSLIRCAAQQRPLPLDTSPPADE